MRKSSEFAVQWSDTARSDLDTLADYIALDSVDATRATIKRIESSIESLTTIPLRGRTIPELALFGVRGYRELIVAPWQIMYRVESQTVYVLAIIDGRRNVEDLLLDRFLR
ncbi:MAG: hypothetical protein AUJ92_02625 [Armatimonadetes bacterium CG2_30_59_28]|nr:type II toxin-antitoxin system RelE/ParE family toxin [Armatimonadota bacterium]OIO97901.1 MAG: hypothetical protein AUJ92_02625 [Armatimonadetes bacterium CG2_30_59_28]PIU65980.1 MAG: plasmid stabilization protein [Armatimonadetes bacterium CG07_land_8_20_14_0_80_59_28]PIX42401.1 MAG: plasmid stabilization protein [Armatimonadetes bacterium CG_4_8_14_3_um_filter_58_9]PIY44138.1 MAG: plasmid stabilization protein [Armatimonadetes bacterium CG_4_10_14_3_um_filter_59_10]PJB78515.1 MAG: plasmi